MVWPGVSSTCRRSPGNSSVSPSFIGTKAYSAWAREPRWMVAPQAVAQFQMAGDKVGVEMGEKDVADVEPQFLGVGQVLLNIALGVDDDRGRTGLVSQQIGGVGEAAQIVLFQNHGDFYSLTFRSVSRRFDVYCCGPMP